jgi:transcriptional regulator with XRE-family HTH domain
MVGDNIRALRVQNNLSQGQLAKKLGVDRSTVSYWESNTALPSFYAIKQLKRVLNCTYEELLEDE